MSRSRRLPISQEEKVAKRIGKELSDFTLDLEEVGKYLGLSLPYTIYSRTIEVLESAQYNKEMKESGEFDRDSFFG
jgi:hypothetical protein